MVPLEVKCNDSNLYGGLDNVLHSYQSKAENCDNILCRYDIGSGESASDVNKILSIDKFIKWIFSR